MLYQIEGSQAVAMAVALCRPRIVCAYPITPQTHIVEGLGERVRNGELKNCKFINVESEMAALSVSIGSQATGVRSYTATSSQGLLFMAEAVYNASGLNLPIVMTLGNRAIGSPINIWNDHTDAMSVRDAGWIMLFAETNQEAVDLHIQAFKIAETVRTPVMVCVDGFILTHAYDRVDIPSQEAVDDFLPEYVPHIELEPKNPMAIGTMVPPEYFMEVRYLEHKRQQQSLEIVKNIGIEFQKKFKRESGGLVRYYGPKDADVVIVAMGSICGTIKDTLDELNLENSKVKYGLLTVISFRPFPTEAIRDALGKAKEIIVVEKAFAVGRGGILSDEIELSVGKTGQNIRSVIAGLGGRAITKSMLKEYFSQSEHEKLKFLGMNRELIESDIAALKNLQCESK